MSAAERACWIALATVPGVGPVGFASMIERYGSAEAAWRAGEHALRDLPRADDETLPAYRAMRRKGAEEISRNVEAGTSAIATRPLTRWA